MSVLKIFKNPNYKGSYDYLRVRRRQYMAYAVLCALLVAGFFLLGWFLTHTKKNLFILPALMSVIPFANVLSSYIAMSSGASYLPSEKREAVQRFEDSGMLYTDVGPIQKPGVDWRTDYTRSKGSFSTLITKNADKPDRIIKFFEFLFTDEGQKTVMCGLENTAWTYNDDGTIAHDPARAEAAATSLEGYVNTYRVTGNWAPWCNTSYWEGLLNPLITPAGKTVEVNDKRLGTQFVIDPWEQGFAAIGDCIEAGTDLAVVLTKVNDACRTAGMKMITAKNADEFNSIYQNCLKEIESLGVAQIEAAYTAEHQKQCEALGIKP